MDPRYKDSILELLRDHTNITDPNVIKVILDDMHQIDLVYPVYKDPRRKSRLQIRYVLMKVLHRYDIACSFGVIRTPIVLEEHVRVLKAIFSHLKWIWPVDFSV